MKRWTVFSILIAGISPAFADLLSDLKSPETVDVAAKNLCETPEIFTHPNGTPALVQCLEDGKPQGKSFSFYSDGTPKSVGSFHHGVPQGEWTRYYPNGQKRDQGDWVDGKPEGDWRLWNEDGSVHHEDRYEAGVALPPVVHYLEISALGGAGLYLVGGKNNSTSGWMFCGGPNQPCYGAGTSSTSQSLQPEGGVLLNYRIWRNWLIELGAVYKNFQYSTTTPYSDNSTPIANSFSQFQTYSQSMIAVPFMARFMAGKHFSFGLGFEFRAYLNSNQQTSAYTLVSGHPSLPSNGSYGSSGSLADGVTPTAGIAYRTELVNHLGLVADFRVTFSDLQLLAGVSYRFLDK